jgi:hypothetical protein
MRQWTWVISFLYVVGIYASLKTDLELEYVDFRAGGLSGKLRDCLEGAEDASSQGVRLRANAPLSLDVAKLARLHSYEQSTLSVMFQYGEDLRSHPSLQLANVPCSLIFVVRFGLSANEFKWLYAYLQRYRHSQPHQPNPPLRFGVLLRLHLPSPHLCPYPRCRPIGCSQPRPSHQPDLLRIMAHTQTNSEATIKALPAGRVSKNIQSRRGIK